jgi:hypothetical protein
MKKTAIIQIGIIIVGLSFAWWLLGESDYTLPQKTGSKPALEPPRYYEGEKVGNEIYKIN